MYKKIRGGILLLNFHCLVVQVLLTLRESSTSNKRQSTLKTKDPVTKKIRGKEWSVLKYMCLTNRGIYWSKFVSSRGNRQVCAKNKIQLIPYSKSSHCNVFVCCNDKKIISLTTVIQIVRNKKCIEFIISVRLKGGCLYLGIIHNKIN